MNAHGFPQTTSLFVNSYGPHKLKSRLWRPLGVSPHNRNFMCNSKHIERCMYLVVRLIQLRAQSCVRSNRKRNASVRLQRSEYYLACSSPHAHSLHSVKPAARFDVRGRGSLLSRRRRPMRKQDSSHSFVRTTLRKPRAQPATRNHNFESGSH